MNAPKPPKLEGLIFPFAEVISEVELFKSYAKDVLDPTRAGILDEAKGVLVNIQKTGATNRTTRWQIPQGARALRTVVSDGASQPADKSKYRARGEFSFVWEIRPLDEGKWTGRRHFLLSGLASTVCRVLSEGDGTCLAHWTVEVGDQNSPGVHFHSQMNGFESPPFPKALDIPRLPALLMSPFLAIESAIGELFQDRWRRYASGDGKDHKSWRAIHRPRLERFFSWQAERLQKAVGSPWMALKTHKPEPDLLVRE